MQVSIIYENYKKYNMKKVIERVQVKDKFPHVLIK